MGTLTYVITNVCICLIEVLQLAMLVRAILSWMPLDDDNKIEAFVYGITEPIIYPIRLLLERFDSLRTVPIDIPFFITYILLILLSSALSFYG
ncbi:MAG: YggT family protein [Clostridia bacterium]|nr:YggT family protein [Clostridia bacterium]